jgi:hypothetical protein
MGGFTNPVFGGNTLIRPAIRSPNYTPGVAGWSINRDGTAELNNLTLRGTFVGNDWILNDKGLFFYSGTPALGNMSGSWAQAAGTDAFGNAYPAGLEIYSALGSIMLSAVDGILQSVGSSGSQVVIADGGLQFSVPGSTGNGSLEIGPTLREMDWQSGQLGTNDRSGQLSVVTSNGTPTVGVTDTFPRAATANSSGLVVAHHYVSGAVVKSDLAGSTAEVWQVAGGNGAAFNANWAASSTFNGSTGWPTVQYRKDAEDNLIVTGCFKTSATWTTGGSPFTMPAAFRPKVQWPVAVQKNVGGTLSTGMGQISAGGNLNLLAGSGVAPVASAEYLVTGVIPLGNLA